jgi:hypothetical protein
LAGVLHLSLAAGNPPQPPGVRTTAGTHTVARRDVGPGETVVLGETSDSTHRLHACSSRSELGCYRAQR